MTSKEEVHPSENLAPLDPGVAALKTETPGPVETDTSGSATAEKDNWLKRIGRKSIDIRSDKIRLVWVGITVVLTGLFGLLISSKFPVLGLGALLESADELEGLSEARLYQIVEELTFASSVYWYLLFGGILAMISVVSAAVEKESHFVWNKLAAVSSATLVAYAGGFSVVVGL